MKKNPQFDLKDTASHIGAAAAGAFVGVFVPRLALLGGLAAIAGGVYYGITEVIAAGGGMMSGLTLSGGTQTGARLAAGGEKKFFDQAKDNANELIEGMKYGLFLDKIYKKDDTKQPGTAGLGEIDSETLFMMQQQLEEQNAQYQEPMGSLGDRCGNTVDALALSGNLSPDSLNGNLSPDSLNGNLSPDSLNGYGYGYGY